MIGARKGDRVLGFKNEIYRKRAKTHVSHIKAETDKREIQRNRCCAN